MYFFLFLEKLKTIIMKKRLLLAGMLLGSFITANAQDSCDTATSIEAAGGSYTVTEIAGEYPETGCWTAAADNAVWFAVTASANGAYRVNTNLPANEGGDTRVAIYSGECGALQCWNAADDVYYVSDDDYNGLTDFQFPVLAGDTYYIVFDNQWDDAGFDFEVSFLEPGCTTTALNEDWTNSASYYFCWSRIDINGDENGWSYLDTFDLGGEDAAVDKVVGIYSPEADANDDFLISGGVGLTAGTEYTLNVVYNAADLQSNTTPPVPFPANESYEVYVLTLDADGFNPVALIGEETGITQGGDGSDLLGEASTGSYAFTPEDDGEYYFGLRSTSEAGSGLLLVFNVTLDGLLGTGSQTISNFAVFPNPTSNVVNVNANNALVNGVNFADLNGRVVKTAKFDGVAEAQVNVSDLASGVYMMSISSDKGTTVKKIVKN